MSFLTGAIRNAAAGASARASVLGFRAAAAPIAARQGESS